MKKLLLTGAMLSAALFANAQTVLFQDSFDTYADFTIDPIGPWTQIDLDGAPTYGIEQTGGAAYVFANSGYTGTAIVFNPAAVQPALTAGWEPRTGAKSLNFFAAVTANEEDPTAIAPNNDWFITPQITLGTAGNVSFYAKSFTAQYGLERIKVAISTTGNTSASDFTVISAGNYISVPVDWTQYTYDLSAYAGQNVYIAINYVSNDSFALLVDDFSVTSGVAGLDTNLASKFSVSPNPANSVVTIANADNMLVGGVTVADMNGRTVKTASFDGVAQASVNISDLANGVYMMTIASDKGSVTKKIVKN